MSAVESPRSVKIRYRGRHDGWTIARQVRFLDALVRTRSVAKAAASAGMSRESAYRLRRRAGSELFSALWDRAFEPALHPAGRHEVYESHVRAIEAACRPHAGGLLPPATSDQFR